VTETASGTAGSIAISDDGGTLAFTTGANLVGNGNADGNPEVFTFDLDGGTGFTQHTFSAGGVNEAVALSGDASTLAWHSNRNLVGENGDLSFEVFRRDLRVPGAVEQQWTSGVAPRASVGPALGEDGEALAWTTDVDVAGTNPELTAEHAWSTVFGYTPITISPATSTFGHPVALAGAG
ncbi:hypothetical protein B7486_76965, partial [cyanobacterium TDX16]